MLTFLFWNINKRPIQDIIAEIAESLDVDVLLLAESEITPPRMLERLNSNQDTTFFYLPNPSGRIAIYTRFSSRWVQLIRDEDGLSIRQIIHPLYGEMLLVAAHLPSRLYRTEEGLNFNATRLRMHIEESEKTVGHTRTVIVGDLNMNPFASGVVAAEGLHGVMDRRVAERGSRTVDGQPRRFFYNPMWSRLGDESVGPPGSYYYRGSSAQVNYFWHTLDQVLIRPELLPNFRDEDLKILTEINSRSLLNLNGLPDSRLSSDHLPLVFRLRF